jgi:hypothetical protein
VASRILDEVVAEKEIRHSNDLEILKQRAKKLLDSIEFSSQQSLLVRSFNDLLRGLSLSPLNPDVKQLRMALQSEFQNKSYEARNKFKTRHKRWMLDYDPNETQQQHAIPIIRKEFNLSSLDANEISNEVITEIQLEAKIED